MRKNLYAWIKQFLRAQRHKFWLISLEVAIHYLVVALPLMVLTHLWLRSRPVAPSLLAFYLAPRPFLSLFQIVMLLYVLQVVAVWLIRRNTRIKDQRLPFRVEYERLVREKFDTVHRRHYRQLATQRLNQQISLPEFLQRFDQMLRSALPPGDLRVFIRLMEDFLQGALPVEEYIENFGDRFEKEEGYLTAEIYTLLRKIISWNARHMILLSETDPALVTQYGINEQTLRLRLAELLEELRGHLTPEAHP